MTKTSDIFPEKLYNRNLCRQNEILIYVGMAIPDGYIELIQKRVGVDYAL
jgi:hypothetical protein